MIFSGICFYSSTEETKKQAILELYTFLNSITSQLDQLQLYVLTTLNTVLESDSGFSLYFGYVTNVETDPDSKYIRVNNYQELLQALDINIDFEQVRKRFEDNGVFSSSDVRVYQIVNYCYLVSVYLDKSSKISRSWNLNKLLHVKVGAADADRPESDQAGASVRVQGLSLKKNLKRYTFE